MSKVLVIANVRSHGNLLTALKLLLGEHEYTVTTDPEMAKKKLDQGGFDVVIVGSRDFNPHTTVSAFVEGMTQSERDVTIVWSLDEDIVKFYSDKVRGSFLKADDKSEEEMKALFEKLTR